MTSARRPGIRRRDRIHQLVADADWRYSIGDQLSIESLVPQGAEAPGNPR